MTDFRLTTTKDRVIEATVGEPITALAHGEEIASIARWNHEDEPLSDEEVAWVRSHVAPLMKAWG